MVSRTERQPDGEEPMRFAQEAVEARLWCGGPGIIKAVNLTAMTCSVQPAVQVPLRQQTGETVTVTLPLLTDVPLMFPAGGPFAVTFPVAEGDECFFHIADRCINLWWKYGGVQPQERLRMHDLSDGFAFVGVSSQPNVFPVSSTSARIGLKSGTAFLEVTTSGVINLMGKVNIVGNLTVQGDVDTTGKLINNNVPVGSTLQVTGVQPGSGVSGYPQV